MGMTQTLVWTQDGARGTDTIHRRGCQHTHMSNNVTELQAKSTEAARREIAEAMGWDDYPADDAGCGFDIAVAPCAR